MITEKVAFPNNLGRGLAGKVYRGGSPSPRGVIFSHGLFSTKDGYKITNLAERIVGAGFDLLAFDFSFSGESGGNIGDLSIHQEVRDLDAAAGFFRGRGIAELHLMGSSMGGLVSLLFASEGTINIASLTLVAKIPKEEVPAQDQGMFLVRVECPVGASLEYTDRVVRGNKQAALTDDFRQRPRAGGDHRAPAGHRFDGR